MKTFSRLFFLQAIILLFSCKSKDGDYTIFTPEQDKMLGKQFATQLENSGEFEIMSSADHPVAYRHLNRIIESILESESILHRNEFAWEVKLIKNDSVYNAFCLPGGYMYVFTGLIKFLESEHELAGVLAHEIAHADLRHSTDQLTKSYGISLISMLILGGDYQQIANLGSTLLTLSFSRACERNADLLAVNYLNDTDYDPKAFASFFERLNKGGESFGSFQFLSTHPNPENRIPLIMEEWRKLGSKEGKDFSASWKKLKGII